MTLPRMAQRGRTLAWAGESQDHVEPKRLDKLRLESGLRGALEAQPSTPPI
jgi:hypothetical protein